MKVSLEREGINVVKLGVEVDSDRALKAYEVACRQLSQRINIPGFRRGKAPRPMVEKAVGVDFIKQEALDKLVPEALQRAISDEQLDIITKPEVESLEYNLGQPLKFSARVEVRPPVDLGNYKGISVTVKEAKLPEGYRERALNSIAEAKADLRTVEPRPVKLADTVLLDFECYVDGKLVEGGKAEGLLLEVKEGNFLEGFCEQLVGKEPGSSAEISASFPDNYRNTELAGKEASFKVDIREVRERVLPEINDELAKSIGHESLAAMEEALEQRMLEELKSENDHRVQVAVVNAVVEGAQVEIPDTMIDRECNLLLSHHRRFIEEKQGHRWEEYVETDEYQQRYAEIRKEARERVRTSLVLGAVVTAENLSVSQEEWMPYVSDMVARYNVPIEQVAHNEELRRIVDELGWRAMEGTLTEKVVDFLVAHAQVEFVPEEEAGNGEPGGQAAVAEKQPETAGA